ncbi:MAG: hypothetical protein ACRDRL_17825 [Sciscionella sp.]
MTCYSGGDPRNRPHRPSEPTDRFTEDLIGLDPADPEAQAFAAHLDRMEAGGAKYTVEGYLRGVTDFANSANRATGHNRLVAVLVVGLILIGVGFAIWGVLSLVVTTFLR